MNQTSPITILVHKMLKKGHPISIDDVRDAYKGEELTHAEFKMRFNGALRTLKKGGAFIYSKSGYPRSYTMEKDVNKNVKVISRADREAQIPYINNLIHDVLKRGNPVSCNDIYKEGIKTKVLDKYSYPTSSAISDRLRRHIITLRNNGAIIQTALAGRKSATYQMIQDITRPIRPHVRKKKEAKIVFKKEDEWLEMCKISIDWAKKPIGNFQGDFNCTREFV